jgi:hypothetical protein
MPQQSSVHPALIYGLVGVCVVSAVFGYRRTVHTRPQRMKQWVALRLEVEPRPQPDFFKLLEEDERDDRLARSPIAQKRFPSLPLLARWQGQRRSDRR